MRGVAEEAEVDREEDGKVPPCGDGSGGEAAREVRRAWEWRSSPEGSGGGEGSTGRGGKMGPAALGGVSGREPRKGVGDKLSWTVMVRPSAGDGDTTNAGSKGWRVEGLMDIAAWIDDGDRQVGVHQDGRRGGWCREPALPGRDDCGTVGGEEAGQRRRQWSAGDVGERPWLTNRAGGACRADGGRKVHETGDGGEWTRKRAPEE